MYDLPKVDWKEGVVYFDCPDWYDCEDCLTTKCPFHPLYKEKVKA
jgi:hypothetical protein